jgi:hypothetical protein
MSFAVEINSQPPTPFYRREAYSEPGCCEEMCNRIVQFFFGAVVAAIGTSFALIGISALVLGSTIIGSVVSIAGLAAMIFGLYLTSHSCSPIRATWQL